LAKIIGEVTQCREAYAEDDFECSLIVESRMFECRQLVVRDGTTAGDYGFGETRDRVDPGRSSIDPRALSNPIDAE
jgi:hypothetical protein